MTATFRRSGNARNGGLLAAQLLLVVLLAATAVVAMERPVRRGRGVGLLVGLAVIVPLVVWTATSFPMAAFDTAMIGDGVVGVALAAVALAGRRKAE